jgi:hypothetical protein
MEQTNFTLNGSHNIDKHIVNEHSMPNYEYIDEFIEAKENYFNYQNFRLLYR